jgi:hypothetical protein|tara:strand:- start:1893 stop:2318 length:426 start_codon:yes stop_codon:yes gene_type:complete
MANLQKIKLNFDSVNVSVQVGDVAYYSYNAHNIGGFDRSTLTTTKKLGEIKGINVENVSVGLDPGATTISTHNINIIVEYDPLLIGEEFYVADGCFISFAKEKKINTSSLLGYYADVQFANDSRKKAELFSVGSIIEESSK